MRDFSWRANAQFYDLLVSVEQIRSLAVLLYELPICEFGSLKFQRHCLSLFVDVLHYIVQRFFKAIDFAC